MRGAIAAASLVALALVSGGAAHAQSKTKQPDLATQNAVADYNAGNFVSARSEFSRAAQKGSRLAEFNYAMMLLNGEGGSADVPEGKKWLRRAADANMAHAQYVYGKMYDDGEFVDRDPAEAHRWFLLAANQGHVQAELALANQFLDGRGTARDNVQAFNWYKKAAEGGDMTAQYVAGSFYERGGDGVERNLNVARAYYAAAAAQGDPAAKLKYLQLSQELEKERPPAQPQ